MAPLISALVARRRASKTARAAIPVMACVPLISATPSLAANKAGDNPAPASASRLGTGAPVTVTSPSPINARARCARGARSPLAPTEPCDGMIGCRPRLSMSTSRVRVWGRMPEYPSASACARKSIIARTTSSGRGSPTPALWLRTIFTCSFADCWGEMCTPANSPTPVVMP